MDSESAHPSAVASHIPGVSVVMMVYNARPFVEEAVRSILGQTFTDFELIIVDDGSTDGSGAILDGLAAQDARIRLVHQPNAGLKEAANRGFSMARAPLIARMDADDVSLPTRFAEQVAWMNDHPDCAVVGTRIMSIDPDGVPFEEQFLLTTHEQIDGANIAGRCAIAHPSAMVRRSFLDVNPPYRVYPFEDLDLWLRMGERGRLANLDRVLLKYRHHDQNVSFVEKYEARQAHMRRVLEEADARRGIKTPRPPLPPASAVEENVAGTRWWLWSRAALASGHYRSAAILAWKGLTRGRLTAAGCATIALVLLGPIGRLILGARRKVKS